MDGIPSDAASACRADACRAVGRGGCTSAKGTAGGPTRHPLRLRGGGCGTSRIVADAGGELGALAAQPSAVGEHGAMVKSQPVDSAAHMPPARTVSLTHSSLSSWGCNGGMELEEVLVSGAVVLIDAQWMVSLAESGGVLPPRQALPDEAMLSLDEVKAAVRPSSALLPIVCISHCWLQPDHPDPRGHNLRIVARALTSMLTYAQRGGETSRLAVFFDYCSIHQGCRDREGTPQTTSFIWIEEEARLADGAIGRTSSEEALFRQALGSLGGFYSHPRIFVFLLTAFPSDYGDPSIYTNSGNIAPYFERGWCFCESSWAMMVKSSGLVLDLGKVDGSAPAPPWRELCSMCRQGRKAPITPDAFKKELEAKCFTNGLTDRPRVAQLYQIGFEARFMAATDLAYTKLGWGAPEAAAVAAVLATGSACKLGKLLLNKNRIGDEGVRVLTKALPHARLLSGLWLSHNGISDEGARALAEVVASMPVLQKLFLDGNNISGDAAEELRAACGSRIFLAL